jgi:hypothetical protein
MLLKLFIFLLPVVLFSAEVVWDGNAELSKEEYDKAIKEYVEYKYPTEVKTWIDKFSGKVVILNGLMWQDNEDTKRNAEDWVGAIKYCQNLELAGLKNWILPTKDKLFSIVDKERNPAIKKEFKYTNDDGYWSSTDTSSVNAWVVFFSNGYQGNYAKSDIFYVRCVRHVD